MLVSLWCSDEILIIVAGDLASVLSSCRYDLVPEDGAVDQLRPPRRGDDDRGNGVQGYSC